MKKIGVPWFVLAVLAAINIALGIWKGFDLLTGAVLALLIFCIAYEPIQKRIKK